MVVSGDVRTQSVASGPAGDVLIGGTYWCVVDFGAGTLAAQPQGSVFLAHLDADGQHLFSGSTGANDVVESVAVGPSGDLFAAGNFSGLINFGSGTLSGNH